MVKKRANVNPKPAQADRWLVSGGFVVAALLSWYLSKVHSNDHLATLAALSVILVVYIAVLTTYGADRFLILAAWVIKYLWIAAAALTAILAISILVIYFLMTFHW